MKHGHYRRHGKPYHPSIVRRAEGLQVARPGRLNAITWSESGCSICFSPKQGLRIEYRMVEKAIDVLLQWLQTGSVYRRPLLLPASGLCIIHRSPALLWRRRQSRSTVTPTEVGYLWRLQLEGAFSRWSLWGLAKQRNILITCAFSALCSVIKAESLPSFWWETRVGGPVSIV